MQHDVGPEGVGQLAHRGPVGHVQACRCRGTAPRRRPWPAPAGFPPSRSSVPPSGVDPARTSRRSRPSWPFPPVSSTRRVGLTNPAGSPAPDRRPRPLDHRRPVTQRLPPAPVGRVPGHGVGQALGEGHRRLPAQFPADLRRVEQVAPVVAGPVGDDLLQRLGPAGGVEHGVGDLARRWPRPRSPRCRSPPPRRAGAPARWPGSGRRRAATRAGSGSRRTAVSGWSSRAWEVNSGMTFSGNWYGP